MPDWIVHMAVVWILCRILYFKYSQFNMTNTVIAMVGSILPDVSKFLIFLNFLSHGIIYSEGIHTPFASLVLAGLVSLLFIEKKAAFLFLSFGILTHFLLDVLLIGPGITLLFPFSWLGFELGIVPTDDYNITIIVLIITLTVYVISKWYEKNKKLVET
jgi:hypothetical protein